MKVSPEAADWRFPSDRKIKYLPFKTTAKAENGDRKVMDKDKERLDRDHGDFCHLSGTFCRFKRDTCSLLTEMTTS